MKYIILFLFLVLLDVTFGLRIIDLDPDPQPAHMQYREEVLWHQAVKEAGLDPNNISEFGRSLVKYPKSIVATVLAMAVQKGNLRHHQYSFMGRMSGNHNYSHYEDGRLVYNEEIARQWVKEFSITHFSDSDIFVNVNTPNTIKDWEDWEILGSFDHSEELGDKGTHLIEAGIDKTFWKVMTDSNFTLCPGGDSKWSMRGYEAALAGSICVIKSYDDDWRPETSPLPGDKHLQKVFNLLKFVTMDQPHVYSASIANDNLNIFIRYLTFIQGDNTPP